MVRGFKYTILYLIILLGTNICFADTMLDLTEGIDLYKSGKYNASISKLNTVINSDPTTAIGYYYLGLAYLKTGKKDLAEQNFNKVINLGSDKTLANLSRQAKSKLKPIKQEPVKNEVESDNEDDYNPILNDSARVVKKEIKQEKPDKTTTEDIQPKIKAKQAQESKFEFNPNREPTNDEIVTAIRILQKAGLLQNGAAAITGTPQAQPGQNPYQQMPQMDSRTQQMNAMLMMMNNNNGNNNMMNMMPYMQQNGGKIDPQIMQMMLMQQMMPNFSNDNNNRY